MKQVLLLTFFVFGLTNIGFAADVSKGGKCATLLSSSQPSLWQRWFPPIRQEVKDVIRAAKATRTHQNHNQRLLDYIRGVKADLTVPEAVKLAKATTTHHAHAEILRTYFEARIHTLSVKEVILLAKKTTEHTIHNDLLVRYAEQNIAELSVAELTALAKATTEWNSNDAILNLRP